MYSPATALAWEFWGRHRLGLAAVGISVVGFAAWCAASPMAPNTASLCSMWFALGLCYTVGVFAYGFDGRLEAAESGFPARMFVLPVRTPVLVGWPMAQGVAAAVLLWLAWDRFVLRPSGVDVPMWWLAMIGAVVAVSQALVWFPFGVPYLRLALMVAALTALVRAPAILAEFGDRFADPDAQARALTLFSLGIIPVAFLVAWAGVGRARRGDSPDWLGAWRAVRSGTPAEREQPPFTSAMHAQMWHEWRTRGRVFLWTVACLLVPLAAMGLIMHPAGSGNVEHAVLLMVVPLLVAPMSGDGVRPTRLTAFAATRPLGNVALVGAKFRAAGVAAVAAWGLALAAVVAWVVYAGGYDRVGRFWDLTADRLGTARAAVACTLLFAGPLLMTWRMLAVGVWAGLTGRQWVAAVQAVVVGFAGLQLLYEWVMWDIDPVRRERLLGLLPWAAGVAVGLKVLVAAWALRVLLRRGELGTAGVGKILAAWLVAAAGLFALLAWLVPAGAAPTYGLALGAVLAAPLARLLVAPVALGWNRHR